MPLPIGQLSMKSYLLKREISFSLRKCFEAWALSLTIGPKFIDLKTSLFNNFYWIVLERVCDEYYYCHLNLNWIMPDYIP